MQSIPTLNPDSHIIEVNKEPFGFSVTHKYRGKILYTGSYERSTDAMRMASSLGSHQEKLGHEVFLLVNTHLDQMHK